MTLTLFTIVITKLLYPEQAITMTSQLPLRLLNLLVLFGTIQLCEGTLAGTQLYPSCTGTGFPNFSYAKGVQFTAGSVPCYSLNTQYPSPPINITWYYYASYPVVPACGNPNLPNGDQCCHSTAKSTITFYSTAFADTPLGTVGTSIGNVSAGAFLGMVVTWELTFPSVASLALNCNTAYGQEARAGISTLTILGGPTCLNGVHFEESCPGFH